MSNAATTRTRRSDRTHFTRRVSVALTLCVALMLPQWINAPSAAAADVPLSVKVNFQPSATTAPGGYTADTGGAYSDTAGMGWVRQDSLAGTHVPFGIAINARDRTTSSCTNTQIPLAQRTFIHMQAATSATTNNTPVAWEYKLPNGRYQVSVGVGDPDAGSSPETHVVNVEGVRAINSFPGANGSAKCVASRLKTATVSTTVSDGVLTIDALGGINTKLAFVTIDAIQVTHLTATPGASSIAVDWDDVPGATGYQIWRGSNTTVATTGAPYGTSATSDFTDPTPTNGTVYYYAVLPSNSPAVETTATGALIDDTTPVLPTLPAKFNFQDVLGSTPAGYTKDYGQNYANVRGFGWVTPGTNAPLSLLLNGRTRVDNTQEPLNSTLHMQYNTIPNADPAKGILEAGAWQLAVANGSYDVEVAVGDATPGSDTTIHRINLEGQNVVNNFAIVGTPTGAARFQIQDKTVQVSDGFLTVDAIGGTNTKIDYITVTPTPADQPPAKVAGLTATAGDGSVALAWTANTEGDLKGYNVFRSTTATVSTSGTPLNGATALAKDAVSYTDSSATNDTTYYYAVVAVDDAGQSGAASATASATPAATNPTLATLPLKVEFADATSAIDPAYTRDYGQAFTNARGRGWVTPGTHTPLNLVGNGRVRAPRAGVDVPARQLGLMHLQPTDIPGTFNGIKANGSWELAVPNGKYRVTVSAGDQPGSDTACSTAPCYDSVHSINVEGVKAIDKFQATAATEFKVVTVTATVADGTLTVDATGGTNSKINYIEAEAADVTAPAAPTGVTATAGDGRNALAWSANGESDLAGYHVYSSLGATVALTDANRLTTTPQTQTTYAHTGLANGTKVSYVITAVDKAGNESDPSTLVDATPIDTTAPAAPADFAATGGVESVNLHWTANAEPDVAEYRVYRSTSSPVEISAATLVRSTTGTDLMDDNRANDVPLFYVVVAVDEAGNISPASAERTATPTAAPDVAAPAAPTALTAVAGDGTVTLNWAANTEDDLAGYQVYRSATSGATGTLLTTSPQAARTFIDDTAANGTKYFYVVKAVDLVGNVSESSNEASATPADTTAPAVPTGVTATAGVQSVTVRWSANTETDLRGYRIYRTETLPVVADEAHLVGLVLKSGGRSFLDSDKDAGTTYYYAVTAEDGLRNQSAQSTVASATPTPAPDVTAPAALTGLTATVTDRSVALSWTASAATDLAGYNVYRSTTAGGAKVKLTNALITVTTFTDASAPSGATSYYTVTAVDRSNNESSPSNQVSADIPAPEGVDAKINFQTDAAAVPAGYTKDIGAAYTTTRGSGWVREDSLTGSTHTPLDMTLNTRVRARAGIDPLLDSMIHMQYGTVTPAPSATNGNLTSGAWEYAVPNGRYAVKVSVGDQPGGTKTGCAAPCYDSTHTVRVEGVTAINAFQATSAVEYKSGTVTVDVADGKLTVDAIGGVNTKLNYVEIATSGPVVPDTTAPAAPSAVTGTAGNASATLTWNAPADADVAGYNVYRSLTSTVAISPQTKVNSGLLTATNVTDQPLANDTTVYYVITAVDQSGNESAASAATSVTPNATVPVGANVKVDFTDAATIPATGYVADFGQAFGARSGANQGTGNTYGWLDLASGTPLNLEGNGRNRNVVGPGNTASANQADLRLASFVHMQLAANTNGGSITPGKWEMSVPNGAYTVTVAVGDAATAVDSNNWINIENQNAIAAFVPTTTNKFATATRTVVVADGRLTLTPIGGTNTKIAYVDIAALDAAGRPYPTAVNPGNGAVNVVPNASVTTDNSLNPTVGAVEESTLLGGNVKVTRVSDGRAVAGVGATSGGGDTVSFQASAPMDPNTLYRFEITSGVKDKSGRAFLPFSSVFTTGAATGGGTTNVAFDKSDSGAATGKSYTSVVIGPDGKLYAASIYGQIYRWTINADGTLANPETINTVRTHATAKGWEGAPNRTVIGMAFDPASTPTNPILWITDDYAYLGSDVPDVTGAISKLTGPNLENYQEVVVNLPRSIKDHETNSAAFHDGKLYVTQGSMNAMGASEGTWRREEHMLSASVLQLDLTKLPASLPVDVATPDVTAPTRGGVAGHVGTYNPYATDAPLTMYATGIRNAFDLLWHSNGHLYTGTNGSAAGGSTPASPTPLPANCADIRPDGGTSPAVKAIVNNQQAETDYIFDIHAGKYYGHPNPQRCQYVLNAGNPTGYTGNPLFKVNAYPAGQVSDPNYDLANVYDAGLHASANGTIEYRNTTAFGGAFAGKMVVVRYSANQELVAFNVASDGSLSSAVTGITGFTGFKQPLDVTEDVSTGNLYVTELTDNPATTGIKLLKPVGGGAAGKAEATPRLVYTDVSGGAASAAQSVSVKNIGGAPLTVTATSITGVDAASFSKGTVTLPMTIAAGASASFPVSFNPTAAGPRGAAFQVSTDSTTTPTVSTTLRGLGTLGKGGSNEPSLQWILDTLQIPVDVGDTDKTNNDLPASSALIGDEVAISSFTKAAFDHAVGVQLISLFGPDGPSTNQNVVTVGAHTTGTPTARTVLLRGPNASNQTLLPAVTPVGEYDVETAFGFDFTWHGLSDRTSYSEDALNTWDPTNPHKVRVYQLKNADGSIEPNSYIVAPEDVLTPVDFQDAVIIVSNVKPAVTTGAGKISASPTELVFSGVKNTQTATKPVTVTNTGTTPLTISSVSTTGTDATSFTVTGTPQTLAVGAAATFTARFNPTTVGVKSAAITVASDDATKPTFTIGLYGLSTNGEQGDNEPPLKSVVDTLGRPINVGGTGLILGTNPAPIGDEVSAPLFVRAAAGVVSMKPVARYSPDELLPFGWYTSPTGDPVTNEVATIATHNEQTLNPAIVAGGASSFDPGTASFGLYVDSKSFGRKSFTQDGLNTNIPHAARTYPAKDRTGALIPNTYLVGFEDAQNGDYQDYVFEVSNVRPATGSATTTPVARIDFQPATSTVAAGYTADTGAAYSTTTGSGWVRPGTSTPLDMTAQTRDRAGTIDARLRTLILMQPTAAQSADGPGAWELAVPNGTYVVTVAAGDPGFIDSADRVQVEGQTAINFVPTTANNSVTGTITVQVTDGKLTIDAIGGTNTKLQYVDIDRPSVTGDTTAPTVTAAVSGLQQSAGVYKNKATVTVTATDAGSGIASTAYSLDGGAFVAYTGGVDVTAVGSHTVRARAQDVAGNVTTTATTTFSIVVAGASKAEIAIENGDGVPYTDRLTMSRIQTPETGKRCKDTAACDPVTGPFFPVNVTHDVATLVIRNTGTEPLNVTGLDITGPFALVTPQTLPTLVAVNGSLSLPVRFNATTVGSAGGLWNGSLVVTSDDADEASIPVELAGFWQSQSENNQEPGVAELAKLFGYGTAITANGVSLNENGAVHASGDEILSPYWLRADATQPVAVRQLAAFHTQGNTASIFWHAKGSNSTTTIFTHAGVEGQSILPHRNGSTTVAASGTFAPTTAFGLKIDGEWSDPTKNDHAADIANGCAEPCGHHLRAWIARDRSGAVIPNTWLVSMDYSGINYDYNDNVYLVSNMKPETAVNPAVPAPLPGAQQLRLGFDTAYPGTLLDNDGQTTGFVSTQPNKLDIAVGSNSYAKALLDVTTAAPGTLAVTSSGTATGGTNGSTDNTLVNGLRLPFDSTGGVFTVGGRVLGSVAGFDAGSEQEAVQFGPDQDNFVKLAVINKAGVPSIEFYAEQNGTGVTIGTTPAIPNPATVTSVDLALIGNPSAGTVTAAYRINDGTYVALPTALTLPQTIVGKFFATAAQAGILVSNKGGTQFVARYDSFGVYDGNVATTTAPRDALYRLDVAGAGNYTDTKGNLWTPDTGRFTPSTAIAEGAATTPLEIAGTDDDVLYRTYRGNVGNVAQAQRVLSYTLPAKGATKVDLRLHFAERASGNNAVGKRVFDIDVEGRTVRSGFDVFAASGALNTATVLPIDNVSVVGGSIDLSFRASVDYPSIAAIEVLCQGTCPVDITAPVAPTGLTAAGSTTGVTLDWADNAEADLFGYDVFRSTSATGVFTKINTAPVTASSFVDTTAPASSTLYYQVTATDSSENSSPASAVVTVTTPAPPVQNPIRINTGGPAVTVSGTSWSACSSLTACSNWVSGGNTYAEGDTITGIPAGMNNTIFQSEWTGGGTAGSRAFGFQVPVMNGSYQVRLHFAELNKTAANLRKFDVRLESTTVLSNFDVFAAAGGIDKAIVRQYPVSVSDGVMTIDFISRVENAKISAIEILPLDTSAPAAVTGLTATAVPTGINLTWTARTESDLAGYNVYRSTSATGTFTKVNTAVVTGATYADTTATAGAPTYYQVTAVDTSGNESARSATANATRPVPPDTTAPGVVTGLTATGVQTGINLAWTARTEADLAGYNLYRSASATGLYTKLNLTALAGTTYADTTTVAGSTYYYRVTALDTTGNESAVSATASATHQLPPDTTAPGVVTGLSATGVQTGVNLAWSARTEADLAGYNVYRSATATGTFTKVNTAVLTGTAYSDTTATAGVPTYYQVTAVDKSGNESARSATATATRPDTTAPGVVTGLTATGVQTGINLAWTARTESDLAGYNVYRSAIATGSFTKVNTAVITGTTYADTTTVAGSTYYYRVTALDTTGNESAVSATASATHPLPPDTTAPVAVTGLTATGVQTGVNLAWTARTESDLAGYNVYRSATATGTFTKVNTAVVTGTTFSDTTATAGVPTYYQVTAVDKSGNESARSATATATRPVPPSATTVRINAGGPAVTTGGVGFAADGFFTGGKTFSNVRPIAGTTDDVLYQTEHSGTAFSYSVPVANGTYNVRLHFAEIYWGATGGGAGGTGKRVFSANIEGGAVELANFDMNAAAAPLTAIVRTYRTTITDGRVDIAFASTVNEAKVSAIEILPADTTAPAAVTGLTATGSTSGVALSWAASTAADRAGYNVYRATSATGTFTKVIGALVTGTTYTDTAAPASATSYYQVTAVDTSGNESVRSGTANATRPATPRAAVRINAGGPAVTTGGVGFAADGFFTGGKTFSNVRAIAGTTDDVLYQTEHSGGSFGYSVPVANGTYDVRLHFAEIYWGATGGGAGGTGRRVFSANIEGGAVELANFDMNAAAAPLTAIVRTYRMTITDGRVDIAFAASVNEAKVSAIEIVPVQ